MAATQRFVLHARILLHLDVCECNGRLISDIHDCVIHLEGFGDSGVEEEAYVMIMVFGFWVGFWEAIWFFFSFSFLWSLGWSWMLRRYWYGRGPFES